MRAEMARNNVGAGATVAAGARVFNARGNVDESARLIDWANEKMILSSRSFSARFIAPPTTSKGDGSVRARYGTAVGTKTGLMSSRNSSL